MKILIVEDDKHLAETVKSRLKQNYIVDVAHTGKSSRQMLDKNEYDLIILDLNLPDSNGIEICKKIRKTNKNIPILALTGKAEVQDKVQALDNGFDDYLTKPFQFDELLARIRALLRRRSNTPVIDNKLIIDDLVLDTKTKTVQRQKKPLDLRQKEFQLLEYLMQNQGIVVSREKIIKHVWKTSTNLSTNTIDVHVQSLRNKIDKPFKKPLIKTIYGFGYILKSD